MAMRTISQPFIEDEYGDRMGFDLVDHSQYEDVAHAPDPSTLLIARSVPAGVFLTRQDLLELIAYFERVLLGDES